MSVTTLIEMDDASEHTLPANIELALGQAKLKSLVLASEILFSNFDTDAELLSKRGAKTLILSGVENTGQVLGGVLKFPNQDRSLGTYSNITDIVDDFAIRSRVEMEVATLVSDRDLVVLSSNVDNSMVRFCTGNQGSGISRVYREITDSSGSIIDNTILGIRNFTTDPDFNIAFSNDDDGNTLTYLDGVLVSTIASPLFDFTDCDLILGNNVKSVASFDNLQLFKGHAITSAFVFPFPEPTTYSIAEETMLTNIPFLVDEMTFIDIILEALSGTGIGHFLVLNQNRYWHNATTWVISNSTLAETNTVAEILANLSTLPIVKGVGAYFQIGHIFKSELGYITPLIESLTMKYTFQFIPDDVSLCIVYGTILDNAGCPIEGATVRVNSSDKFFNAAFIGPSSKVLTNAQGKFSISVVETETDGTAVDFTVEYTEKKFEDGTEFDDSVVFEYKNRVVPDFPTKKLSELLELV